MDNAKRGLRMVFIYMYIREWSVFVVCCRNLTRGFAGKFLGSGKLQPRIDALFPRKRPLVFKLLKTAGVLVGIKFKKPKNKSNDFLIKKKKERKKGKT